MVTSDSRIESVPLVTVVVPVRNEAKFIIAMLSGLLAQDYPTERLEVIVADGMSNDGTRESVTALANRDARLTLIDNPGRIVSTGLNAAIARARGTIVIRIDGHAEIAPDFVRQSVALLLEHPEAWVVGGPIVHAGRNAFSKAAARAMSSPLGVGMATHRFSGFEGHVEGAQFPAFWRWVIGKAGWFDEHLVRNQDDEWNYRVAKAGGRCYISPRIRYKYFVRDSPGRLFRQYFQYSFWRIPVIRKHKRPTTVRQVIPPAFFLLMLAMLVAGLVGQNTWTALALPLIYATSLLVLAVFETLHVGARVGMLVPVAVGTMHVAYALGFGYGALALLFRRDAWSAEGPMTRLSR